MQGRVDILEHLLSTERDRYRSLEVCVRVRACVCVRVCVRVQGQLMERSHKPGLTIVCSVSFKRFGEKLCTFSKT